MAGAGLYHRFEGWSGDVLTKRRKTEKTAGLKEKRRGAEIITHGTARDAHTDESKC